jgi:Lar family restriction alleviation protein
MAELKSCPFCGSTNVRIECSMVNDVPLVHCKDCAAVIIFPANKRDTLKKSAELWNRRAEDGK